MITNFLIKHWILLLIILAAFALRVVGLSYQSFWLDELHTMNETTGSWDELFSKLRCCDPHPPLSFVLSKLTFEVFGSSEFTARMITAIAGTVSVWAMYLLGITILNKRLGLIAATLAAVNFYSISYSQEARPYIFSFLFSILSFVYFIRLLKDPAWKNRLLYAFFTLLLLYSHYYGLFILASQACLALLFIFQNKGRERKDLAIGFFWSGLFLVVGYLPWVSRMFDQLKVKSFWITGIQPGFLQEYFFGFFGNSELIKPLLVFLLMVYIIRVSIHSSGGRQLKLQEEPLVFSFVVCLCWIFITVLIPYLRSILVVPMLYARYCIVILPAFLLMLAYGIELFSSRMVKVTILGLFLALSFIDLFADKKFYMAKSKTQFREMTSFVVKNNSNGFPILNSKTAWHQGYYLNKLKSNALVFTEGTQTVLDSILRKTSSKYDVKGFWLVGAHNEPKPDTQMLNRIDTAFKLLKQKDFYDAWAQLYVSSGFNIHDYTIAYNQFLDGAQLRQDQALAIWNGTVHAKPIFVKKGIYTVTITSWGTKANHIFPHLVVYINGNNVSDYFATDLEDPHSFVWTQVEDGVMHLTIEMDNDFYIPESNQDRNAFVKSVTLDVKR